ncbi:MAG: hypothetical protein OXL41_04735 [Nitrospinae bacterium]|nr:hypothetical protein [Nitrospinota bacterium]
MARALGVNLRTVSRWLALYRSGEGVTGCAQAGRRPPKLEEAQCRWVYETAAGYTSLFHKLASKAHRCEHPAVLIWLRWLGERRNCGLTRRWRMSNYPSIRSS